MRPTRREFLRHLGERRRRPPHLGEHVKCHVAREAVRTERHGHAGGDKSRRGVLVVAEPRMAARAPHGHQPALAQQGNVVVR